jgi:hypothetical protein
MQKVAIVKMPKKSEKTSFISMIYKCASYS